MPKAIKERLSSDYPFRFIHDGFKTYQARWLVQQGKLISVGRGIYHTPNVTEEEIHSSIFSIFLYRYPESRLMGESARRVFMEDVSPVIQGGNGKQWMFASGDFPQRRERILFEPVNIILRPEKEDDQGHIESPFLKREKQPFDLPDEGTAFFYPVSPAQMLLDGIWYPECAVAPKDALVLLKSLPENHLKKLMEMEGVEDSIKEWQRNTKSIHPVSLHKRNDIRVWIQDTPAGYLTHNGIGWKTEGDWTIPGVEAEPFLQSLLPETAENYGDDNLSPSVIGETEPFLKEPRRLMNLVFVPNTHPISEKPSNNRIEKSCELSRFVDHQGVFIGQCKDHFFQHQNWLGKLHHENIAPKLSGMQPKVGAFINTEGELSQSRSVNDPFTIVAKLDPHAGANITGIPVLEWVCQRATRLAGLPTPETALVVSLNGQAATILSERFDVPRQLSDNRLHLALDGSALMGIAAEKKYRVSTQALWKSMEKHFDQDHRQHEAQAFFDRFALAWAMSDGDLHAKNISVLFHAKSLKSPWTGEIAPIYDTVCTRALLGFEDDLQALPIEGMRKGLNPGVWDRFGKSLGLSHGGDRACEISAKLVAGFQQASAGVSELFDGYYQKSVEGLLDRANTVIEKRATTIMRVSPSDIQNILQEQNQIVSFSEIQKDRRTDNLEDENHANGTYCQN